MADTGEGSNNNKSGDAAVAAAPKVKTEKKSNMTVKSEGDGAERKQKADAVVVDSATSFARWGYIE